MGGLVILLHFLTCNEKSSFQVCILHAIFGFYNIWRDKENWGLESVLFQPLITFLNGFVNVSMLTLCLCNYVYFMYSFYYRLYHSSKLLIRFIVECMRNLMFLTFIYNETLFTELHS